MSSSCSWRPRVPTSSAPAVVPRSREAAALPALAAHRREQEASGELLARRRRCRDAFVIESLENRYGSYGVEALGGRKTLADRVASEESATAFALADALGREIEETVRKPL